MRSRRKADPFAGLSESAIAGCRAAAAVDFSYAVAGLSAAVADVRRAGSPRERLEAAYGIFRCSGRAIASSMRFLRLSAHRDADAGATPIASAREVRRSARSTAGTA